MSQETENFWAGDFGNDYLQRNQVDWEKKVPFFRNLAQVTKMSRVLEIGCNAGWNLRAIGKADPNIELAGCDINEQALRLARKNLPMADINYCRAAHIREYFSDWYPDMVMTAGVLIHIPPEEIKAVMENIAALTDTHVLAIEYDHPTEEEVLYRGHDGKLWKRPYGRMYEDLGLTIEFSTQVGPELGFGEGCTAWLLRGAA